MDNLKEIMETVWTVVITVIVCIIFFVIILGIIGMNEPAPGTAIEREEPETPAPTERKTIPNQCSRVREVIYNWESDQKYEKYVLDCYDKFNRKVTEIIHIEGKSGYCRICFETNELEFVYNLNRVIWESYEV